MSFGVPGTSFWLMAIFLAGISFLGISGLSVLRVTRQEHEAGNLSEKELRNAVQRPASGREHRAELRRLSQAGLSHPLILPFFFGLRCLSAILVCVSLVATLQRLGGLEGQTLPSRLLTAAVAAGFGFWLPTFWVEQRRNAWRRRIEIAIPDALDFMLVCVEAGQSLDLAAQRVATELEAVHPDLAGHFQVLTKSLAAGAERQDAFQQLAQNTESDDLRQFSTLVVQSANMGTPIAHSLRVFAADLRDRRVRKVEEKAAVLPTKMSLGTMLFTVPPLLILLLTPSIWRIAQMM